MFDCKANTAGITKENVIGIILEFQEMNVLEEFGIFLAILVLVIVVCGICSRYLLKVKQTEEFKPINV